MATHSVTINTPCCFLPHSHREHKACVLSLNEQKLTRKIGTDSLGNYIFFNSKLSHPCVLVSKFSAIRPNNPLHMPDIGLHVYIHHLIHFSLQFYPFLSEKAESEAGQTLVQGHTASKWASQGPDPI
jgi:hypothetical protein